MERLALIVGATGGIGSELARALLADGYRVRALHRNPESAAKQFAELGDVEWLKGDAMNPVEVRAAAQGASVLVHAANPPGYRNWRGLALPMLESSILAARATGARLVLPGTVYNFGPELPTWVDETAPQRPQTRKGKIRVEMEERLREASQGGLRVLIVRAGDFFGPRAGNSWFSQGVVKPNKAVTSVTYPGQPDAAHSWAYLPDLAATVVKLLARNSELGHFEVFHFRGHSFERGVELAERTCAVAGLPKPRVRRFPWFAIYLLAPFVETFREMLEMKYLWSKPLLLDNGKLRKFLGEEPHTPIDEALRATLSGLGCLPQH